MQEEKSAREKMLSKLERLWMSTATSEIATEDASLIAALEKSRDNSLARFVVTLMHTQR